VHEPAWVDRPAGVPFPALSGGATPRANWQDEFVTDGVSAACPVLQSLFAMMHPEGLENYRPTDPRNFAIQVMAFIGTGDGLVDSFDFVVCTPSWLADHFP
jgi:hypothetical protein